MQTNSSDLKAEAQKIASALSTTVAGSVSVTQDNAKTEITGLSIVTISSRIRIAL